LAQQPQARPQVTNTDPAANRQSTYGLFQDRPEAAVSNAQSQPAANALDSLDRSKVMSFQFRNAPWSLVLAKFAGATGLELRMQAIPDGAFNRWDSARYTPSQTLTILNAELAKVGCQANVVGSSLCVIAAPTNAAIQTSAMSAAPVSAGQVAPASSATIAPMPAMPSNIPTAGTIGRQDAGR
jgi:hypothetical protein